MRVEIESEAVVRNVRALGLLVDQLDALAGDVRAVRAGQGMATWSPLPSAQRFATAYGAGIDDLATRIGAARAAAVEVRDGLKGSAAALGAVDESVVDRLQRLARRAPGGPVHDPRPVLTPFRGPAWARANGQS